MIDKINNIKESLSNWKDKKVHEQNIDELFLLDGYPLSWFYRPILYSGLLPSPFPTPLEYVEEKPSSKSWKFAAFPTLLRASDRVKQMLLSRLKEPTDFRQKVLFLTFTNLTTSQNLPFREERIIAKINKDNYIETYLLGVDPISALSPKKIRHFSHTLYQYADSEVITSAQSIAQQLAERWKKIPEEEKRELFKHDGKEIFAYFKPNLDFLYSPEFIFLLGKYYYSLLKLLEKEHIVAAVSSSQNNLLEKCLIAACHKKNIPVFIVQHGIALGCAPTLDPLPNVYFEVFGKKYQKDLIAYGVPKTQIDITGPVIFDGIEKFTGLSKKGNTRIMLATSPLIEDHFMDKETYFQRIKMILIEIQKMNFPLVIKTHPREKYTSEYLRLAKETDLAATLFSLQDRKSHYALICESSLIITFGSTVALEAMIIGRPTLSIKMFDEFNPANQIIINSNAAPVVSYKDTFAPVMLSLLQQKKKQPKAAAFVREICSNIDGKSVERIVNNIYTKVKRSSASAPSSS